MRLTEETSFIVDYSLWVNVLREAKKQQLNFQIQESSSKLKFNNNCSG